MLEHPLLGLLAPLLAGLIGWLAWSARRRRWRAAAGWSAALGEAARAAGRRTPWLLGLAALAGALALAGPRYGRARVTTETRALNVVLAVDISRSMLAEDTKPNRLQRALAEARRIVQEARGDRVGLLAFAGRSYILAPLTVDGSSVRIHLDAMTPDLASEGGTSLAGVLAQGRDLLTATQEGGDRVLVVFTDGEGHDSTSEAVAAAAALAQAEVHLVLVAQGGATPARIPLRDERGVVRGHQRDPNGADVLTARRDDMLGAVAEAARATIIPADAVDQAGQVRALLAALDRASVAETRAAELVPRGWIPLLAGALLLLGLTLARRTASLVALLLCAGAGAALAQRPSGGVRALERGDTLRAAERFLADAKRGRATDTSLYNAGTAALLAGRTDVAEQALGAALSARDPELRYRALYNQGLLLLREARRDSVRRDTLLDRAARHFREALLLQPGAARAKWNLELATREPPPSQGGGGGGSPQQAPPSPSAPATPPPRGGLSREQADQILNSMDREEQQTRQAQQKRRGGRVRAEKDW